MNDTEVNGSRAEFLASVQRLTRIMLDRLANASQGKDIDDKEIRMLGNMATKALRTWERALPAPNPKHPDQEKQLKEAKNRIAKPTEDEE